MKKIISLSICLLFLFAAGKLYAINDSCLKLLYPHDPDNGFYNLDSVMIDTCHNSSTYNDWYVKKYYAVLFELSARIFKINPFPKDTFVTWDFIDTSYIATRNGLKNIYDEYGHFIMRRIKYYISDSEAFRFPAVAIAFNEYLNYYTLREKFEKIDKVIEVRLESPTGFDFVEENNESSDAFKIFPNPAQNVLLLKIKEDTLLNNLKITILNNHGNVVLVYLSSQDNSMFIKLNISALPTGLYFCNFNNIVKPFIIYR